MTGDRILALHGNLGAPSDWSSLGLSDLRAVDLWEHAGCGFLEMAGRLAGTLSSGMERPVLAGYSLGGRLALHALVEFPERWSGAVILSAHPGLQGAAERDARIAADARWAERARRMAWGDFLDEWNAQPVFAGDRRPEAQRELEVRREEVARAFEQWSLGRQQDLRARLVDCTVPVTWIAGERDAKFVAIATEMAAMMPRCRLVVVRGAGHRLLARECGDVVRGVFETAVG